MPYGLLSGSLLFIIFVNVFARSVDKYEVTIILDTVKNLKRLLEFCSNWFKTN